MNKHSTIKVIAVIVVLIVILSASPDHAVAASFPDVVGHWAETYINVLWEKGIISGMGDGLFHPNEPVTTAQFVKMVIYSSDGIIPPVNNHWASGYFRVAVQQGVVEAHEISFADQPLLRQSAAKIGHAALLNLFNEANIDNVSSADRLGDLSSCQSCIVHIKQFYAKGIMIGRPDNNFYGGDTITRAEAAVVIAKMLDTALRTPQISELSDTSETGLISPDEALRLLNTNPTALLVDVRSREEHTIKYIENSICVPLTDMMEDLLATEIPVDKNTIIILYCQKGSRSQTAYAFLKGAGYTNVYSIGGIDDWPL